MGGRGTDDLAETPEEELTIPHKEVEVNSNIFSTFKSRFITFRGRLLSEALRYN